MMVPRETSCTAIVTVQIVSQYRLCIINDIQYRFAVETIKSNITVKKFDSQLARPSGFHNVNKSFRL